MIDQDRPKTGTHTYFPFGPLLGHVSIKQKHIDELLKRGRETTEDYRQNLAGHLDKENAYTKDDRQWFMENFQEYIHPYMTNFARMVPSEGGHHGYLGNIKGLSLYSLWINFMKQGEYNPPHTHNCDFSFVIYLQVPDDIAKHEKEFKGSGAGPGCVSFYYGEQQPLIKHEHHFIPVTGDMFIFPAKLRHMVSPFKSKEERISVSGNLILLTDGPIDDNIQKD